jgi:hypothetical protein
MYAKHEIRMKQALISPSWWHTVGLFFDPEDEGNMFLRNVCLLPTGYTALVISQKI